MNMSLGRFALLQGGSFSCGGLRGPTAGAYGLFNLREKMFTLILYIFPLKGV